MENIQYGGGRIWWRQTLMIMLEEDYDGGRVWYRTTMVDEDYGEGRLSWRHIFR